MRIDELIEEGKKIVKNKKENNQSQYIDEEFLSFAVGYKYGGEYLKILSEKWLINFFVNSGMVASKRDITNRKVVRKSE